MQRTNPAALLPLLPLLPLLGVMLLCPQVLSDSVSSRPGAEHSSAGGGGQRPRVVKRSVQNCDSSFENFCLNHGQCFLLLDLDEHHCKCESGFHGPRCGSVDLVFQPLGEEQVLLAAFCVTLLLIGLTGSLYFCCRWYKKNKFPRPAKRQGYRGVQTP